MQPRRKTLSDSTINNTRVYIDDSLPRFIFKQSEHDGFGISLEWTRGDISAFALHKPRLSAFITVRNEYDLPDVWHFFLGDDGKKYVEWMRTLMTLETARAIIKSEQIVWPTRRSGGRQPSEEVIGLRRFVAAIFHSWMFSNSLINSLPQKEKPMTDLHYRLTDETKTLHNGNVLHRIQATRDLPRHGVKAGDLGGWVQGTHNLFTGTPEQNFGPWIADEAIVMDKAIVWGHALIAGEAHVAVEANISGYARVDGRARVAGYAIISRNAHVTDQARVLDHAQVTNDAIVYGDAFIAGSVTIMDNAMVGGSAHLSPGIHAITGNALIESTVDVMTFMPAISGLGMDYITLTKTPQMVPHVHTTGFDGSLDEFEEAVRDGKKYFYFSTKDKAIRDELLVVCDVFRARVKRWSK